MNQQKKELFKIVDDYLISLSEPLGGGAYGKVYKGYFNNKGGNQKKNKLPHPAAYFCFTDRNNCFKRIIDVYFSHFPSNDI